MPRSIRALLAVVIACLAIFAWWMFGQLKIDSCLDRGGRWDYEDKACEGATDR